MSDAQASCGAEGAAACPNGTVCADEACYGACEGTGICADGHACVDGACKGPAPSNTGGTSGGGTTGLPQAGQSSSGEGGVATGGEAPGGAGGAGGEGGEGPVAICVPNARTCDADQVITCNADGTAFLPALPCAAKQTCVAGVCEAQECTPNTDFCSGNSVRSCADNGLSSQEKTACGAGKYCDSSSATCKSGVCAPNQPACDGNSATTCNATGSGYVVGGTPCKATETCQSGACIPHACIPNATSCQGQDVKKCAANGLSSSIDSTCSASKTCVQSGATASCAGVCGPGQTNCSGNGVQPCSASGQWGQAVACTTSQTCVAGLCTGCPTKTVNCDDISSNGCEIDLTSTSTCGTTCSNVVACSSQNGTASCSNGTCDVSNCSASYEDCGGTNDGCETNLSTNPDSCSACGKTCSANHMATRTCSGAVCNGACATGYGDCDSNKQTNGCETPLNADANHCGNCATVCKYRSCQASVCVASTWGDNTVTVAPTTTKLAKDKLWAIKIQIAPQGVTTTLLQALGIVVVVNGANPAANIRMGLYTDSGGGAPNALEAQTTAFVTANGISEKLLAGPVSISTGAHWVAFVADQDVRVHADVATVPWISASVTYAGLTTLPAAFPLPTAFTVERGHLFAVTTP